MLEKKIYPPTGSKIKCKNWQIEAAYRMIQHNVCNEVAEYPEELIVYGGKGKAARNWDCFESILDSLVNLEEDETLLIQSGKPDVADDKYIPVYTLLLDVKLDPSN